MFQPILSLMDRAPTNPGNFRKALRLKPAFRHRFAWGGELDAGLPARAPALFLIAPGQVCPQSGPA
jgi:hypothetical protein